MDSFAGAWCLRPSGPLADPPDAAAMRPLVPPLNGHPFGADRLPSGLCQAASLLGDKSGWAAGEGGTPKIATGTAPWGGKARNFLARKLIFLGPEKRLVAPGLRLAAPKIANLWPPFGLHPKRGWRRRVSGLSLTPCGRSAGPHQVKGREDRARGRTSGDHKLPGW